MALLKMKAKRRSYKPRKRGRIMKVMMVLIKIVGLELNVKRIS